MSTPRRPLIAGNWKMNGLRADGGSLASGLSGLMKNETDAVFDLAVCPPFTLIAAVGDALADSAISLGAQDCHPAEKGAHTGNVSMARPEGLRSEKASPTPQETRPKRA